MAAEYWIKLYIEVINDPKLATLPDRLWRRMIEMFLLAGKLSKDKSGIIPDTKQLAWLLRMETDDLQSDLEQLASTGMIQRVVNGWIVVNYQKRQSPSTDAERKRNQREREREEQYYCHEDVTDVSQDVRQINRVRLTETDTETDTETEQKSFAAADKKISKTLPEEQIWLNRIIEAFGEKFQNPHQVKTALQIRGQYGEEKGWDALSWYASKGISIGEGCARAFRALPTWGSFQKHPPSNGNGSKPQQPSRRFNPVTAIVHLGWTEKQCLDRMKELGISTEEAHKILASAKPEIEKEKQNAINLEQTLAA